MVLKHYCLLLHWFSSYLLTITQLLKLYSIVCDGKMKTHAFWDMRICHWECSPDVSEGCKVFVFVSKLVRKTRGPSWVARLWRWRQTTIILLVGDTLPVGEKATKSRVGGSLLSVRLAFNSSTCPSCKILPNHSSGHTAVTFWNIYEDPQTWTWCLLITNPQPYCCRKMPSGSHWCH